MLALSKPPYLRWVSAVALIVAALLWDLNRQATQLAPFAATRIERGAIVTEDVITWKPAPVGLLPGSLPDGATALVVIEPGDPIIASTLTTGIPIPAGWWTIPVDTPSTTPPGTQVRIVLGGGGLGIGLGVENLSAGVVVPGVVVVASREDSFGLTSSGLVAVPEAWAADVAIAAGAGQLTILYEP